MSRDAYFFDHAQGFAIGSNPNMKSVVECLAFDVIVDAKLTLVRDNLIFGNDLWHAQHEVGHPVGF